MAGVDGYTKLLSHFNGADGATGYTAETGQVFTFVNSAQLDTAQKKFGVSSLLLNRDTDDYITTPITTDFNFGSGDFTIDLWGRQSAISGAYQVVIGCGNNGGDYFQMYIESGELKLGTNPFGALATSGANILANEMNHLAMERHGNNINLYVRGVKLGTVVSASAWPEYPGNLCFGGLYYNVTFQSGYGFTGWMDEIRICKGVARYQGNNFTPPLVPYGRTPGGIILLN